MELRAHLHLIKLLGVCQAETTLKGTKAPDKRAGYPDDGCRGHCLSVIWAGCQGADCQRPGKSGTIRRWVIYGVWLKKTEALLCLAGIDVSEHRHPQPCVLVCACRRMRWYVRVWQIFLARLFQHHFPSLFSAQMFACARPITYPSAHMHTHKTGSAPHISQLQLLQQLVGHGRCLY